MESIDVAHLHINPRQQLLFAKYLKRFIANLLVNRWFCPNTENWSRVTGRFWFSCITRQHMNTLELQIYSALLSQCRTRKLIWFNENIRLSCSLIYISRTTEIYDVSSFAHLETHSSIFTRRPMCDSGRYWSRDLEDVYTIQCTWLYYGKTRGAGHALENLCLNICGAVDKGRRMSIAVISSWINIDMGFVLLCGFAYLVVQPEVIFVIDTRMPITSFNIWTKSLAPDTLRENSLDFIH